MIAANAGNDEISKWDVVIVPFPFTDRSETKRRPALVLSDTSFSVSGHSVLAMITTAAKAAWPSDVRITDLAAAGLTVSCVIRFNIFTIDNRLVLHRAGHLGSDDIATVKTRLRHILCDD